MVRTALKLLFLLWLAGVVGQAQSDEPVTIMAIQGAGPTSPLDGRTVETAGVVTAVGADGRQFWIQDPAGDGDPATSDGVRVGDRNLNDPPPVGALVRLVARVREERFGQALPRTTLGDVRQLDVLAQNHPLPEPVWIDDLPDASLREGIEFWERLEGMRVRLEGATVVAPTSRFGEFAVLAPRDARPGSGYVPRTGVLLLGDLGGGRVDYNPERVLVDDAVAPTPDLRPGDAVAALTGVVDYTFGAWKVQHTELDAAAAPPPAAPVSARWGRPGTLRVTTFNLENLFDTENDPRKDDEDSTPTPQQLEVKLAKLAAALELELALPEIVVVQEAENQAVLAALAARVNAAAGTNYVATSFETSDRRGIEVGFLHDADRVRALEVARFGDDAPGVAEAFGVRSPSRGREPLQGVFQVGGRTLTVIGNHFKSKGGDDPPYGVAALEDKPFLRPSELQRKAQARVVRQAVNALLAADPEALVMVAGDLNDFPFGEPGEGDDHPLAILEGGPGEVPLTNLVNHVEPGERYTFVFDGNAQVLDHILVSPALLSLYVGVDVLHFNAGYPAAWAADPSTPLRASDHDAVEARFDF